MSVHKLSRVHAVSPSVASWKCLSCSVSTQAKWMLPTLTFFFFFSWAEICAQRAQGGFVSYNKTNWWVPSVLVLKTLKNPVHSLQIPLWDLQYRIFIITSWSFDCCPLLFSLVYPTLFPEIASASHLTAPSCVPLLLPYYISCPCSVFLSLRCKMWLEMWQHIKCTCGSTTNLSQIISEGLRNGSFPLRMSLLPCLMRAHLGIPDSLVRLAVIWQHEQNRATLSSWAV